LLEKDKTTKEYFEILALLEKVLSRDDGYWARCCCQQKHIKSFSGKLGYKAFYKDER